MMNQQRTSLAVEVALALSVALASLSLGGGACGQIPGPPTLEKSKADRHYKDGPLTAADFQGTAPAAGKDAATPYRAMVYVDIVWSSQHRTIPFGRGVAARLTSFEAAAASDPARSWNRWRQDEAPALLDHEQGHFDIVQIHAKRLELKLRKLVATKKPLLGQGESEDAAVEALESLLEKEYAATKALSDEENREFDRLTEHGTATEKQGELRRVQQETLKRLEEDLKKVRKK
jgi:hypothetical protein